MSDNIMQFSTDLLAMYYDRLFPYDQFEKWLSYGQGEEYLYKREFSFTLENDQYIRYKAFKNANDFKTAMTKQQPHKIDLGAIFSVSPADKSKVQDSEFSPIERELIFDVDLTDYDDVRTCCKGATICIKCWKFMIAAVKVLDAGLREDFGFENILWVYSGRRGIHCWVADSIARSLTNEARSAVVSYFSLVEGNENAKRKVNLKYPLHPHLERSYKILEPLFEDYIINESGQGVLSKQESWITLLNMIPDENSRKQLEKDWTNGKTLTAEDRWKSIKNLVNNHLTSNKRSKHGDRKLIAEMQTCIIEIIFSYLYPRLDANVSKQRNHLLKIPFAVHPKTGRVCVPINGSRIESFNPFKVPTLGTLDQELNKSKENEIPNKSDVEGTSLGAYVQYFEKSFLNPIQKKLLQERREDSEKIAASTGDW